MDVGPQLAGGQAHPDLRFALLALGGGGYSLHLGARHNDDSVIIRDDGISGIYKSTGRIRRVRRHRPASP
jgi:hypothetical protein